MKNSKPTWKEILAFAVGDGGCNLVWTTIGSYLTLYYTDSVGLAAAAIGTMMLLTRLLDGISDLIMGSIIDRTHTKWGKARPWMLYAYIGCAVTLVANFAIPDTLGTTAQYAWFFIAYTLLNAVFYTANNIAYEALTSLVTKNAKERVEMGSFRFMFSFGTNLLIQSITFGLVASFGGGAAAWRIVAIIYCIVGIISNTLSCFSVKELSDAELRDGKEEEDSKLTLAETFKLLISNKYFVMICVVYILQQLRAAMLSVGTYFMTYVLFNQKLFGVFSWAINIPLIIALAITPTLVAKARGMYKLNKYSYVFATICRLGIVVAGYLGSIPLMLVFTVLTSLGEGPWQGDVGAVIANCSEHTYLKTGKRIDGSMFSCTSFGTKLGGGIGVALSGWLLDASGYVNNAAVQSASCISMMNVMYLWLPFAFDLIITIILSFMNIEGANEQLKESME